MKALANLVEQAPTDTPMCLISFPISFFLPHNKAVSKSWWIGRFRGHPCTIVSMYCNVCHKMCAKSMFSNEGIIVTKGYNTKMPFDQHITNYIIFRHGIKNCVSSVFLVTVLPQRKLKYIPHLTKQCLFTWLAERWIRNPIYKPRLLTTSCMKNNRVTNIWQCKT